jgi:hypothetical protein
VNSKDYLGASRNQESSFLTDTIVFQGLLDDIPLTARRGHIIRAVFENYIAPFFYTTFRTDPRLGTLFDSRLSDSDARAIAKRAYP